jgi:hypothetical protein
MLKTTLMPRLSRQAVCFGIVNAHQYERKFRLVDALQQRTFLRGFYSARQVQNLLSW